MRLPEAIRKGSSRQKHAHPAHDSCGGAKAFKKTEQEIAASLADSRKKLFDVRAKRPRPHLDDKIITAWNGLMISAFARAAQVLDEPPTWSRRNRRRDSSASIFGKTARSCAATAQGASDVAGFADDYAA